ncbi:hypothetical protein VULLAG_LOCUS12929 [Vulpes lagopus]
MFSCCVPTSRGSGFQKPQGCGFFKCCRLWFHRHTPRLKAFARRRPKSSTQEMGQEWEEEIQCSTSLMNRKVPCTANRGQCGLKVSAGSEVIKTGRAAGVECLPRAEMPGVESKPMYMVVIPLIHCPNVEEPPEPLANLEKEQARASAIQVPKCLSSHQAQLINQLRPLSNITKPRKEPTPALTVGPYEASGPEVIEQVTAAGAECLARAEMPAAESEPMHVVVTPLIHCPDVEEPPAPLATPEEE